MNHVEEGRVKLHTTRRLELRLSEFAKGLEIVVIFVCKQINEFEERLSPLLAILKMTPRTLMSNAMKSASTNKTPFNFQNKVGQWTNELE